MDEIFQNNGTEKEQRNRSSQEQAALLKRRIEEMKKKQTILYMNPSGGNSKQSDDECYAEIMEACNRFLKTDSLEDEIELSKVLEKHNLQLYYYPPNTQEFTATQNAVARMAFNGVLPPVATLRPRKEIIMGNSELKGTIKPEDYDFKGSAWEVFRQIPEFAELEVKLREGLAKKGIGAEILPKLSVHDYCYILDEQLRKYPNQRCIKFMQESHKARNTKRFISENETEFRAGMMAMEGIKAEYVETLIRAMKTGVTDLTKYRENGQPVWKDEWADQPVINVHHIVNVKDSNAMETDGKKWYNVNDYENMCFIVTYPQHQAMHALEKSAYDMKVFGERRNIGKKGYYRIQPPEGVKCMLGFNNMIYDRKFLNLSEKEKADIKEKSENHPNRRSGSRGFVGNPKNNSLAARRNWHNQRTDYVKY